MLKTRNPLEYWECCSLEMAIDHFRKTQLPVYHPGYLIKTHADHFFQYVMVLCFQTQSKQETDEITELDMSYSQKFNFIAPSKKIHEGKGRGTAVRMPLMGEKGIREETLIQQRGVWHYSTTPPSPPEGQQPDKSSVDRKNDPIQENLTSPFLTD